MDPVSSGGNTEKTKPTVYEISQRLDKIDISDSDKLSKELAGLTDDMNAEIRDAFEDGKITKNESSRLNLIMSNLCGFSARIKTAMQGATEDAKNVYEQVTNNVSNLVDRLTLAMNGKDPDQVALEPGETDAQQLQILDKKATKLLYDNLAQNQARIDSEQNWYLHHGQIYKGDTVARPDKATLDNIIKVYKSVTSDANGYRIVIFADVNKAQQLIDWAGKQQKLDKIDSNEYDYLTQEARDFIRDNKPAIVLSEDDGLLPGTDWEAAADATIAQIHEETPVRDGRHN